MARRQTAASTMGAYQRDINRCKMLSADEERDCSAHAKAGDLAARNRLVESCVFLVVSIAKRFVGRGLPIEDLVSAGNMGLIRAVDRFEPARGRLTTIASVVIAQYIKE